MPKKSQKERLLEYLLQGGEISRLDAFYILGIFELSARICQLEREGYIINKTPITVKNRYGEMVRVIKYSYSDLNHEIVK